MVERLEYFVQKITGNLERIGVLGNNILGNNSFKLLKEIESLNGRFL